MKTFQKYSLIIIIGFLFFLTPQPYTGALWEEFLYEELIEKADLIVIGTNNGIVNERIVKQPEFDFDLGFTDWEIQITSYLKGETKGDVLLVTTPGVSGGISDRRNELRMTSNDYGIDDITKGMEAELEIEVMEIIFFLEEREGYYQPITPKAIAPLQLLYWEEYLTPEIIGDEEIDFEHESFQDLEFLRNYIESSPRYSPSGELQNPAPFSWVAYLSGFISLVLLGFIILFVKRKRGSI